MVKKHQWKREMDKLKINKEVLDTIEVSMKHLSELPEEQFDPAILSMLVILTHTALTRHGPKHVAELLEMAVNEQGPLFTLKNQPEKRKNAKKKHH